MIEGLVSIIMPSYNAARFIGESINSVLLQTYSNWELLIVDDCSKDNTVKIIQEYEKKDDRIKVIDNEGKNLGAIGNFFELIKKSTGCQLLCFCGPGRLLA